MNKVGTLILLGGTGFVGRAIAEKYLKSGWQVIIPTKSSSVKDAKRKVTGHGFDSAQLEKFANSGKLMFVPEVNLRDRKWIETGKWLEVFKKLNIDFSSDLRVVNLVSQTSGSAEEIIVSNADVIDGILALVGYLKFRHKSVVFCNMGSTAERKISKNSPPYERSKRTVKEKIDKSKLCDYHFVANYIKGRGEQKMTSVAPYLWAKLKFSYRWIFGFEVSVVGVDDLADIIYRVVEVIKPQHISGLPMEVNITSGEMIFGEMIENLLPQCNRVIPSAILSSWPEKYFLKTYAWIAPWIKPNDQLVRRLANFARKGSLSSSEQDKERLFKTAEEIKRLSRDSSNHVVLKSGKDLIIMEKEHPILYILRERSGDELKQIIRQSIIIDSSQVF